MTIQEAKSLERGTIVHHATKKNKDGTPMRARVTSVKIWKTRPDSVVVHVVHGLHDYATFNEKELDLITTERRSV
jgi:hypothetical protein